MPTLTLPEARTRFREATQRFNVLTAQFVNLVIEGRQWPRDDETIAIVADLIMSADAYAAVIAAAPPAVKTHVSDETVLIAAVRDAALMVMADVNPEQVWFWTKQWQAGERAAEAQIAHGEGTVYESAEDFIAALESEIV